MFLLASVFASVFGMAVPEGAAAEKAFVVVSSRDPRYLELSDGSRYIPIGLNMIAPPAEGFPVMEQWMAQLAQQGGNYIRVWLSNPFFDVEHARSGEYDEEKAKRIEQMLECAGRNGIRVKMCLEHFRHLGGGRQAWAAKPLHLVSNGGTATNIADFFNGQASRELFKRKLAWYAKRFGDNPTVFGWELWNEINAVQGGDYLAWTEIMLPELHRLFPKNLAMQSLGSFDGDYARAPYRRLATMPGNDVAQVHRYLDLGAKLEVCHGPMDVLAADAVRELLSQNPGRPVLLAESGAVEPSHSGPFKLYEQDKQGMLLHDVLFAPFFAGAAGPGHIWHWDQYVAKLNLWHHFGRFAEAVRGIDPPAEKFEPLMLRHDRLRVYALKGRQTTLLWCRDSQNTWRSELAEGKAAELVQGAVIDLTGLGERYTQGTARLYDPWKNAWTEAAIHDGRVSLPDFKRSIVVRIRQPALTVREPQSLQKEATPVDLFSDTWVATDGAGRVVPGFAECGPVKPDKWVGIFYWTWHVPQRFGPNDNTRILAEASGAAVRWPTNGAPHHWGEPELGYYLMTDPFVIRKHASMLADAGIDVILFDTTNPPFTWKDQYEALCREYQAMRAEGNRTPAIAFIAPFGDPRPVTDQLWRELYNPGKWKELWFIWEGKPLLLADKSFVKDPDQQNFFTFRKPMPDYWLGPSGPEQWSWLEVHPQHVFKNRQGEAEQMSVGVAQNALPATPGPAPMSHKSGAMGRSWHNGRTDARSGAVDLGLNFTQQWQRALEVNPKFVFVTGWNEWIAGRYTEWSKYTDAQCYYPGGLFVDEYTQEYSRDCEPMRGGHTDNYYYQLASWVRKFKGVRPPPMAKGPSRIEIDGAFDDWKDVQPEFRDTLGDVVHRDHSGYGDLKYRNDTGRNDFAVLKAAYDNKDVYFYAQTVNAISPATGPNWMLLFIDADQRADTGWLGYDFVVNLGVLNERQTTVKRWRRGRWELAGKASYRVSGNAMELAVSRKLLGQSKTRNPSFDFHWADDIQSFEGVAELGVNGDSAPNRRWNYRYQVSE